MRYNRDSCRPHKHAVAHIAFKVPLALNTAIILSRTIVQLDANPFSDRKERLADEADNRIAAVGETDDLPYSQV